SRRSGGPPRFQTRGDARCRGVGRSRRPRVGSVPLATDGANRIATIARVGWSIRVRVGQVRGRILTLGPFTTVSGPGPNTYPRVGIASDGAAVAVWDHLSTVMAAVRSPAGRWSAPQQLSPVGRLYPAVRPDLAV